MRVEFIACKSYHTAKKRAPWATALAKAEGGYMAFEDERTYRLWARANIDARIRAKETKNGKVS